MTRKKTKQQALRCPEYTLPLPKDLADLLHQRQDDRYTKYEAFRYLAERQALNTLEDPDGLLSPFVVTITQLSVDWGWHRHTVTAFLEDLVILDVITMEKTCTGFKLGFTKLSVLADK